MFSARARFNRDNGRFRRRMAPDIYCAPTSKVRRRCATSPMRQNDYVKLAISEKPSGRIAWVMAKVGTAEALGWLEHFETFTQHVAKRSPDGLVYNSASSRWNGVGGKRVRIGFSSDYHRPRPGDRRQFKVGSTCSLFDLAELAHFTSGDWEWMSTPAGVKRTRCEWDSMYQAAHF